MPTLLATFIDSPPAVCLVYTAKQQSSVSGSARASVISLTRSTLALAYLCRSLFMDLSMLTIAMQPTTPVTATRLLNFRQLPGAYQGRRTAPSIHEPQVLTIDELFLSNRTLQDFETLPEHHPVRAAHNQRTKVGSTQGLPKLFCYGHVIRIHKPRLFKRFPIKQMRMQQQRLSSSVTLNM